METGVGLGDKRERKEDEGSLGLGFGCGSDSTSFAPQKLIRTTGFPFLSSCTTRDASSVPTSTPFFSSGPTMFLNDAYDGGRALQPFPTPFKSPGVGMGVGGGASAATLRAFPFTSAQWQELQRQALIYKHIIASVPVPSDLLFPGSPTHHLLPNQIVVVGRGAAGAFNMRFSSNTDPEPGRCRRTDGKKWRCSRDAAPDQKYCERHLHRGRPRSRKPVEVSKTKPITPTAPPPTAISTNSTNIVAAATTTTTPTTTTTTTTTTTSLSKSGPSQSSGFPPKDELKFPFQPLEPNKEPRYLYWIKGNNEEMESNLQWELMHSKIGLSSGSTPILQNYDDQMNSNYTAFLNSELCSLDEDTIGDHRETPRSFIDAWSTENPAATTKNGNLTSVPTGGELPLSTLTLSMSGVEEGGDHRIQMGLGVGDTVVKTHPSGWIAPSPPLGGPLGEVLQTSNATSPRLGFGADDGRDSGNGRLVNAMSSGFHGHEASPQESPTRLASSPSGVLQKATVSLSDSSSSSSPTFAAASRSEIALQWMNQTKQ